MQQYPTTPQRRPAWTGRAAPPGPGYFARHWRGELPLIVSFWINALLLGVLLGLGLGWALAWVEVKAESLRVSSMAVVAAWSVASVFSVWSTVGAWRSASAHWYRLGGSGWATLAKFVLFLGVLSDLGTAMEIPTYVLFALGRDPLGEISIEPQPKGRAVVLSGPIVLGSSDRFKEVLDATPAARSLLLDSPGGRVVEARKIADLARARGLSTQVNADADCMSACTLIFLAGENRVLKPGANLGFHRASTAGPFNPWVDRMINAALASLYADAGLSKPFIANVLKTSSRSMWFPSRDELASAGAIVRPTLYDLPGLPTKAGATVDDFRDSLQTSLLWQELDLKLPGMIDRGAEALHKAHARGARPQELQALARNLAQDTYPMILLHTTPEAAERFVVLVAEQQQRQTVAMTDASSCLPMLTGDAREAEWLLDALQDYQEQPRLKRPTAPEIEVAQRELGIAGVAPLRAAAAAINDPRHAPTRCAGASQLMDEVAALSSPRRRLMARLMFQSM